MSSQPRLEIQGPAPFKQSGVYEAQIVVTDSKPSDDDIHTKQFSSLWSGNFHLRVKDGIFSETLGSPANPLPSSIANLDKVWIVVTDLFSSLHTVFDVPLARNTSRSKTNTTSETKTITDNNCNIRSLNRTTSKLLGYEENELMDQHIKLLFEKNFIPGKSKGDMPVDLKKISKQLRKKTG